jgi:hypothetical protein
MQDAGGDQMEDKFFPTHHQSMTGIIASLEADDATGLLCEQVHDFTLAFVAPLASDYHYACHGLKTLQI